MKTTLTDSWPGPYTILERNSPLSYWVSTVDRMTVVDSVNKELKWLTGKGSYGDLREVGRHQW